MHSGRIALLDRAKKAEEELLDAICAIEGIGAGKYVALEKQRLMVVEAMGAVYRHAMAY